VHLNDIKHNVLLHQADPCCAVLCCAVQVTPMTEILLTARGRYHDLLASRLQQQLTAAVEADVLNELEVRTEARHLQLVQDLGLPWLLEGATPGGLTGDGHWPLAAERSTCIVEHAAAFTILDAFSDHAKITGCRNSPGKGHTQTNIKKQKLMGLLLFVQCVKAEGHESAHTDKQ
jgi:hypothetical protein